MLSRSFSALEYLELAKRIFTSADLQFAKLLSLSRLFFVTLTILHVSLN